MNEWHPIDERADQKEANGDTPGYLCLIEAGKEPDGGYPYMIANGAWLNARGKEYGITHWMPLPAPPNNQANRTNPRSG